MDCSLPSSSVHGIFQVRIQEWVTLPSSRDLLNAGIEPRSPTLEVEMLGRGKKTCPIQKQCNELCKNPKYIKQLLESINAFNILNEETIIFLITNSK